MHSNSQSKYFNNKDYNWVFTDKLGIKKVYQLKVPLEFMPSTRIFVTQAFHTGLVLECQEIDESIDHPIFNQIFSLEKKICIFKGRAETLENLEFQQKPKTEKSGPTSTIYRYFKFKEEADLVEHLIFTNQQPKPTTCLIQDKNKIPCNSNCKLKKQKYYFALHVTMGKDKKPCVLFEQSESFEDARRIVGFVDKCSSCSLLSIKRELLSLCGLEKWAYVSTNNTFYDTFLNNCKDFVLSFINEFGTEKEIEQSKMSLLLSHIPILGSLIALSENIQTDLNDIGGIKNYIKKIYLDGQK